MVALENGGVEGSEAVSVEEKADQVGASGEPTGSQPEAGAESAAAVAATTRRKRSRRSRYVPAIDGLRAFAVVSVILYHMHLDWAPGGFMGVTVFFVISGYLINGLLVAEHEREGRISLKGFWLRRARRILPAVLLAVVGTVALCTLFDNVLLDKLRSDVVPSLLFYNNWWQVFHDVSYFESAGAPSPLEHFWSLSIEEQFYLAWPLLLLLMYRLGLGRKGMSRVVLALAVLSAAEMALLFDPHGDPSRIYYGTDTRAMSLLLGVWLAFVWPSAAFDAEGSKAPRTMPGWIAANLAGVGALLGLVAVVVASYGFSAFPYYGGIALVSVLTAALIAALVIPHSWVAEFFALPPLVWIGKLSYGMYLWHFPILLLTSDPNSTAATPWWTYVGQFALTVAAAWLSYTFVEDPIRKGRLRRWWKSDRKARAAVRTAVPAVCFAGLLGIATYGLAVVEPTDFAATIEGAVAAGQQGPRETAEPSAQDGQAASSGSSANAAGASDASGSSDGTTSAASAAATGLAPHAGAAATAVGTVDGFDQAFLQPHYGPTGTVLYEPLLIGDSVSLGSEAVFYQVFPYGHLDSVVSRNIWESPYQQYFDAGQVGEYVVFCLGTNNALEDSQVDDMLQLVGRDKRVFLVNTRSNTAWFGQTNAVLAAAGDRYPNVTVLDWYGASEGHDDWFAGDGTHLTEAGAWGYVSLIEGALREASASS